MCAFVEQKCADRNLEEGMIITCSIDFETGNGTRIVSGNMCALKSTDGVAGL